MFVYVCVVCARLRGNQFWLFKIVEELKVVECAASELVPRIDLLEKRIKNAEVSQADEGLVGAATKVGNGAGLSLC